MRLSLSLFVALFAFSTFAATSSDPNYIGRLSNIVFFTTRTAAGPAELWRTDGTSSGTFRLAGANVNPVTLPGTAVVFGDALYFQVRTDTKVWRSDGTIGGTFPITPDQPSGPFIVGTTAGRVLYLTNGLRELWRHDAAGETLLATIRPSLGATIILSSVTHAGMVFVGTEFGLWKSDGTVAGTTQLTTAAAYSLAANGKGVFFIGHAADTGDEIWLTDGTIAGTRLVSDLTPGSASSFAPGRLSIAGNSEGLFFFNTTGLGFSDGTAAGTRMIRTAKGGGVTVFHDTAYFQMDDGEHGNELWRSDGTDAGTMMVADSFGPNGGVMSIAPAATRLYYYGFDTPTSPLQLFETDGTAAGTHAVFPSHPADWRPGGSQGVLFTVGDTAFFAASDNATGIEPWITDGTEAGTHMIVNVAPEVRVQSTISVTVPASLVYGSENRFTATVTGSGLSRPTGGITMTQDGIAIASDVALFNGTTTWTVAGALTPGTHTYIVSYSGDENFLPASTQFTASVRRAAVHLSASPVMPDTLRIWVTGYASAPAGSVTVLENGTTERTVDGPLRAQPGAGSVPLSYADASGVSGTATSVTVTYSGDDWYEPQTAAVSVVKPSRTRAVRH
jgi:ELWxxDGT repeat protein